MTPQRWMMKTDASETYLSFLTRRKCVVHALVITVSVHKLSENSNYPKIDKTVQPESTLSGSCR